VINCCIALSGHQLLEVLLLLERVFSSTHNLLVSVKRRRQQCM